MLRFLETDAHAVPAPMGGGWIVPDTERGERVLRVFFGEQAQPLPPIQEKGWIVEPYQITELVEYLQGIDA